MIAIWHFIPVSVLTRFILFQWLTFLQPLQNVQGNGQLMGCANLNGFVMDGAG
jgi:hypothetical protein